MAWTVTSALACDYSQAAETFDVKLGGAGSTHTVTIAAGTRRVGLAASATDILQVLQTAMNAPAPALPGGTTFTVTWGATGRVTITCTGDTFSSNTAGTRLSEKQVGRVLGFDAALTPAAASFTAALQPQHVALMVACHDGMPLPVRSGGADRTTGGKVYGFWAAHTTYDWTATISLIPWTPTQATAQASPATPLYPDMAYVNSLGVATTARAWSWMDFLQDCANADCGWAEADGAGVFQTARVSTAVRFYQVRVGPSALEQPQLERQDVGRPVFATFTLPLVLPSSGATTTRA